ncbi:MAG: radical SAM protein [Euryarchaeota archaeon]|nr:radical SAM protein [Euryarchaeota archaeon]
MLPQNNEKLQVHGLVRVFSKEEIQVARAQGQLLSFDIELTRSCNLQCIYCYADGGQPLPNELTVNEIRKVIDEAKELGAKTVNFTGGEPLLHKDFFSIAKYAYDAGLQILVYTNGTLITREVAEKILSLKIFPCVKLDTTSPFTQDFLAGINGAFNRIMEGINNLMKVGYGTKYQLNINTVICKQNIEHLPELWVWARKRGIQPSLLRLGPKGRAIGKDLAVKTLNLKELFEKISEIDKQFGENWEPVTPFCGRGCHKQYISCFITSQGFVQPCTGVDIHAGNIREEGLRKILSSSEVFKITRNIDKHLKGACGVCKYLGICYGCRGLAYYLSGDYREADPLCWHNPLAL